MVQNGRIPLSQLTDVYHGNLMINSVAVSVKTLIRIGKLEGITITTPEGGDRGISGYRDLARQALFVAASKGNRAAAVRCNMDPSMKTNMGAVGYQSHGFGDRIDLLFNGDHPTALDLALVERYGGVQEFGDDDKNHMWFKRAVSGVSDSDKNRIVAHFLNGQHLGRTTTTDKDGTWPVKSNFSWMVQEYGSKRKGWYPQPQFKIDGERGSRTIWVRNKIFTELWAS